MPRYKLPVKPILIVDSREKMPFDFESDDDFAAVEYRKLDAGDYSLVGLEDIVTIERKKSMDELYNNLAKKQGVDRFLREVDRMPRYRFIILEASWEDIFNTNSYYVNRLPNKDHRRPHSPYQPRAIVLRHFLSFMIEHNIHIIPASLRAQSITKYILLYIYQLHRKGQLDTQNEEEV